MNVNVTFNLVNTQAQQCTCSRHGYVSIYCGPHILRPPIQPEKGGFKLKAVLKWRDISVENERVVSLLSSLKIKRNLKMERS